MLKKWSIKAKLLITAWLSRSSSKGKKARNTEYLTHDVKQNWTHSILFKMVTIFLLLIIIPITTITVIATSNASSYLKRSAEESVASATMQTSQYFVSYVEKAQDISKQIFTSTKIQEFAALDRKGDSDPMDLLKARNDASAIVSDIQNSSKSLKVNILLNTGTVLGTLVKPEDMNRIFETSWYKKLKEAKGKAILLDNLDGLKDTGSYGTSSNKAFSLARIYKSTALNAELGVEFVEISYDSIIDILSDMKVGKNETTFLITPEGRVLSEKGPEEEKNLENSQYIKEYKEHALNSKTGLFYSRDNKYLIAFNQSPDLGLTALTTVPTSVILAGAHQIRNISVVIGLLFILFGTAAGFLFSLGMSKALKSIMDVMSGAEGGDLTVSLRMSRKDEFGSLVLSFNQMIHKIRQLLQQNYRAAEEVADSSSKVADISSEHYRVTTEITRAIVEVASGASSQASEIESSVRNVTQLAERITKAVEKTSVMEIDSTMMKKISDEGLMAIETLNMNTAQTNEITASVVQEIAKLNGYVKSINVITNVLRSISDQTNLLSLNATIEAARAGEYGKGFAVVADEIRKLAEKSNEQTREIQKHIENIFKQAQVSMDLVTKAEVSIHEQSKTVATTAKAFNRISETTAGLVGNIACVGDMIKEMDAYKEGVLASMENISAVSEEVSASTQEVSASTEEQLASFEQLNNMAKNLNELAMNLISQMEEFTI